MPMGRTYLDHNATSPVRPEVRAGMSAAWDLGNPSSVHREGRQARAAIEAARRQVAALLGCGPDAVTFTSGGTEANATALRPGGLLTPAGRPVRRLVVGATEHASVLHGHGFPAETVAICPVDHSGVLDLVALGSLLKASPEATLVTVQAANSETGVLQPIADIASRTAAADAAFHTDAVQAAGRLDLASLSGLADAVTLSAHKLGGPTGAGALAIRPDRRGPAVSWLSGSQESGRRGGTENVAGIVGFGVAAACAARDLAAEGPRLAVLRDRTEHLLRELAPDATIFGEGADRLPNTLAFAVPGLSAETALMGLDLDGVAVSSGSACSSGKVGRSHVLAAMGVPAGLAGGAIRVSFGWNSAEADVERFASGFATLLHRLYEVAARAA